MSDKIKTVHVEFAKAPSAGAQVRTGFTYEALGPIPGSKRVMEYTVDWCQGAEVQTVLRTFDRKKAVRLNNDLHAAALRLNKLGVDVCVEMSSESTTVAVPLKKREP